VNRITRIWLFPIVISKWMLPEPQSSRFPTAGRGERSSGNEIESGANKRLNPLENVARPGKLPFTWRWFFSFPQAWRHSKFQRNSNHDSFLIALIRYYHQLVFHTLRRFLSSVYWGCILVNVLRAFLTFNTLFLLLYEYISQEYLGWNLQNFKNISRITPRLRLWQEYNRPVLIC